MGTKCCERDFDSDGNCDRHPAGVPVTLYVCDPPRTEDAAIVAAAVKRATEPKGGNMIYTRAGLSTLEEEGRPWTTASDIVRAVFAAMPGLAEVRLSFDQPTGTIVVVARDANKQDLRRIDDAIRGMIAMVFDLKIVSEEPPVNESRSLVTAGYPPRPIGTTQRGRP